MADWSAVPASAMEDVPFVCRRVAYFGKVHALLSLSFMVVNLVLMGAMMGWAHVLGDLLSLSAMGQELAILVSAVQWLVCRGGRLGPRATSFMDAGGMILIVLGYSTNPAGVPDPKFEVVLATIMAAQTVIVIRAIIIPSRGRRTFWISAIAVLPVLASTYLTIRYPMHMPHAAAWGGVAYASLWCALMVAVATLTSRIIFGLRQKVRDAAEVGQYTLEEKIGEGGMGTVYRARHALLRRTTAIKLLQRERAGAKSLIRFEREVQQTSLLTHPNTVAIYDYGHTADGVFYYAMEFLDGVSLEELVTHDGAQPAGRVVGILRQLCGALAEAHARGLVHRDVKPANVLLCVRGDIPDFVKVLDFGLVKEIDNAAPELSIEGAFLGTPLYIAPEALKHAAVTDRADVYAVGGLAYCLLTGTPPFRASTLVELCSMHLYAVPEPPSQRAAGAVPAALEALVLRCLDKDPDERPAAAELARLLAALPDVAPWTEDDAARWWRERAPKLSDRLQQARRTGQSATHRTVAVDVRERERTAAPWG